MLHDPAIHRLGKRPARKDPRTLKFARYVREALPPAPPACDYGAHIHHWGMLGNDQLGDCTCAGILHAIMIWNENNEGPKSFTSASAVHLYERLCGYVPGEANTDQGGVELDILKTWRKEPLDGCQLSAFLSVDPANWLHVKLAHWLAGSLYMGLNLPESAQNEAVWHSLDGEPGSWGGHCVVSVAYAENLECVTWGERKQMTPQWLARYCDELWVPVTPSWTGADGKTPAGFDMDQLMADVAQIGSLV